MVLPYGGTLEAIRLSVKAAVLAQLGVEEGEVPAVSPWHQVETDGYGAFKHRALADHPLFNEDIRQLASLIHRCITPAIPKAMACMDTLQSIGKWVGDRGLAWATGPRDRPLWVVQAKSKSARKQVTMRGYHLPNVIRRLTLISHTNDVDPRAHRTGIVANFIHSLDAEHLMRTVSKFKASGGTCVGVIHDCVMCRPSEVALMHRALREAFKEMYLEDPLSRPVKLLTVDGTPAVEYADWYALAKDAGTAFPKWGSWEPEEVLASQWFFS
jgi:DNA-directed RNA polymerase